VDISTRNTLLNRCRELRRTEIGATFMRLLSSEIEALKEEILYADDRSALEMRAAARHLRDLLDRLSIDPIKAREVE